MKECVYSKELYALNLWIASKKILSKELLKFPEDGTPWVLILEKPLVTQNS